MEVRIGTTVHGHPVVVDTNMARPLLLVSDVGRGKTTTARYLARWWLAATLRHAHVYTPAPGEWADLRCEAEHPDRLVHPLGQACRPRTCLVIVDSIDDLDEAHLAHLAQLASRGGPVILTSYGGNDLIDRSLPEAGTDAGIDAGVDAGIDCVGLIRPDPVDPAEAAVLGGQGRLDWPAGTIPVIADQRGPTDFPPHRWQIHTKAWTATAC